jgi:alpha-galactosidase
LQECAGRIQLHDIDPARLETADDIARATAAGEDIGEREHEAQEYAPQFVHGVVTGTPRTIVANVPNAGLIHGLSGTYTAEVPATVDGNGIHPRAVGALPLQLAAVNAAHIDTGRNQSWRNSCVSARSSSK